MKVSIKENTYEMDRNKFKETIKQIKKMIPKKPTIIAVEKDNFAVMCNEVYNSQKALTEAVADWNKKGYRVQYTRGLD